jgi:branched-chain amino acid transport system substrate-binding protein
VTIAFQGPLTGPEAQTGKDQLDAVKFAVHHFNKRFEGVLNVSIVEVDDQGDPSVAPKVAPAVAANSDILGLVGPSYSGATIASLSFYKAVNLPMVSPSATRTSLTDPAQPGGALGFPVFHRVVAIDKFTGPELYKIAIKDIPNPRVVIVDDQHNWVGLTDAIRLGADVASTVGSISVPHRTVGWSGAISQINNLNANVVIYTGYPQEGITFFSQLRVSGYKGVIAGSDAFQYLTNSEISNKSVFEGFRLLATTIPISNLNSDLERNYRQVIGRPSGTYATQTIDATNVILSCLADGVATRIEMLQCIDKFNGTSISGNKLSFNLSGDASPPVVYELTIRSGSYKLEESFGRAALSSTEVISLFPWYDRGSPEARIAAQAKIEAEKNVAQAKIEADKKIAAAKVEAAKILAAAAIIASKASADKIRADAKLEAARILAAARAAASKKITIVCMKGKVTKKITAVKAKCPSGYVLMK